MNTKEIGRLYVQGINYLNPRGPLAETGWSQETEYPYRAGKCIVFRIPRTKYGLAVGWWGEERDEAVALTDAIGLREIGDYDNELLLEEAFEEARASDRQEEDSKDLDLGPVHV